METSGFARCHPSVPDDSPAVPAHFPEKERSFPGGTYSSDGFTSAVPESHLDSPGARSLRRCTTQLAPESEDLPIASLCFRDCRGDEFTVASLHPPESSCPRTPPAATESAEAETLPTQTDVGREVRAIPRGFGRWVWAIRTRDRWLARLMARSPSIFSARDSCGSD